MVLDVAPSKVEWENAGGLIFLLGPGIVLCGELDAWVLLGYLGLAGCCPFLLPRSVGLESGRSFCMYTRLWGWGTARCVSRFMTLIEAKL